MTQSFKEILENLHPNLKKAFYSDSTLSNIEDAANLGQINADPNKSSILEEEVMNVLLGRSPLGAFKETLRPRLNIPEANLTIISKVIQDKIFESLKNELRQLQINQPKLTSQGISQKEEIPTKEIAGQPFPDSFKTQEKEPISNIGGLKKIVIPKDYSSLQKQEFPPKTDSQIPKERVPLGEKIKEKKEIPEEKKISEISAKEKQKVRDKEIKPQREIKKELPETIVEKTVPKQNPEQEFSKQSIPEYSFPEPSEIKVEKPVDKTSEFKKVIAPETTPSQQDKIRQKLLEAMVKKDLQPKIVNEMKNVLISKQGGKKEKKEQEELPKKKLEPEKIPSEVLSGEGKKFQDEEPSQKISDKKPYILDVKLKEMQKKKEAEKSIPEEPIQYQKYKKESPFGQA